MDDAAFERWLLQQVPGETSSALDRRVLGAAKEWAEGRRRPHLRPAAWLAAAAALLALAFAWHVLEPGTTRREARVAERAIVLPAPGEGAFAVGAGSRYLGAPRDASLDLVSGAVTASAGATTLHVRFPGGRLRLPGGRAKVIVTETEDPMKKESDTGKKRVLVSGAIATVVVMSGVVYLEVGSGGAGAREEPLGAGERATIETEATPSGEVRVKDVRREPPAEPAEPGAPRPFTGVLVPLGSRWRYWDAGSHPGEGWQEPGFDDAGWSEGPAELGYGDGGEATLVAGGPADDRHVATYFRHAFRVPEGHVAESLLVKLRRDDGAVVWLDGAEIFRSNLPSGPIGDDTLAVYSEDGEAESRFFSKSLRLERPIEGTHVLAVEVHQAKTTSSDVSFDLELLAGWEGGDGADRYRGRAVDAETGEPVGGARAAWIPWWISASSPRGGSQHVTLEKGRETFILSDPLAVSEQVPGVSLPFAVDDATRYDAEARTDRDGVFTLPERRGTERLLLVADGYLPWAGKMPPDPPAGDASGELPTYALARKRVVVGRIVGADGQPPLVHANLDLEASVDLEGGWRASWPVPVGDDLTFACEAPPVPSVSFACRAEGYREASVRVELASDEASVDIVLEPTDRVSGRVTTPAGAPIAGAKAIARSRAPGSPEGAWRMTSMATGEDGRFVNSVFGSEIAVEVQADGFSTVRLEDVVANGEDLMIVLQPAVKGVLVGRVVDAAGAPIEGVRVLVLRKGGGLAAVTPRPTTGADGAYRVDLWPDAYDISFDVLGDSGREDATGSPSFFRIGVEHAPVEAEVTVLPGPAETRLDVAVPEGGRISGESRDAEGKPRAREVVHLYRVDLLRGQHGMVATVETDAEGRFELVGFPAGTYSVYGMEEEKHRLVALEEGKTVNVRLGGSTVALRGKVLKAGSPLKGATIAAGTIEGTLGEAMLGTTDEDGAFAFDKASPGSYFFHLTDPGTGATMMTRHDFRPDEGEIVLSWPTATLTVRVGGSALAADAGVLVERTALEGTRLEGAIPAEYRAAGRAERVDDRTWRIEGIGPGAYRVRADGAADRRSVDVEVGTDDVTVTLP